jgi:hypothetical protein
MFKDRKEKLDKLAAITVYANTRPFTLYECPAIKDFLFELDFTYKPLTTEALANKLLEEAYTTIKE